MLEVAYFLITLDHKTPAEVARAVRRVPGITEAVVTMGEIDIIAIGQMEGTKGFPALTEQLKRLAGIATVTTYVVVRP